MCGNISLSSLRASWPALSLRRGWAICCCISLLLLLTPRISSAQTTSPAPTPPLSQQGTTLLEISELLVTRLTERQSQAETQAQNSQNIEQALNSVTANDAQSSTASSAQSVKVQSGLNLSQAELLAISNWLGISVTDFASLSKALENYKQQVALNLKAVEKERDAALVVAKLNGIYLKIGIGVISVAGIYEGGRALKWWK
jgi:hypothetical protein